MHPTLLKIGPLAIHSYGVLIAIGFLICIWVVKHEGERLGIPGERVVDIGFWSLLVGMVGSRILFVFTRLDYFSEHPIEVFFVWQGGLVFWGGPLACIPFFLWYTKKYKMPRLGTLDLGGLAIPIAHAFGRMGCLTAGCCYGKPTDLPWSIRLYSDLVDPSHRGVPLHPVQIYESVSLLALFCILFWMIRHRKFEGQIALSYLILYSIIRSITEVFRGDVVRGFVIDPWLSTSQFISILVVIGASLAWIKLAKQKR